MRLALRGERGVQVPVRRVTPAFTASALVTGMALAGLAGALAFGAAPDPIQDAGGGATWHLLLAFAVLFLAIAGFVHALVPGADWESGVLVGRLFYRFAPVCLAIGIAVALLGGAVAMETLRILPTLPAPLSDIGLLAALAFASTAFATLGLLAALPGRGSAGKRALAMRMAMLGYGFTVVGLVLAGAAAAAVT